MEIEDAANAPLRSVIGGETIEEHNLKDRIEFERWKAQQNAASELPDGRSMIRRTRLTHRRP
jgi:hypothetical protein